MSSSDDWAFDIKTQSSSCTFEEVGDVLELRDAVFSVAAALHQQREGVVELPTRVGRVQSGQLLEDCAPGQIVKIYFRGEQTSSDHR